MRLLDLVDQRLIISYSEEKAADEVLCEMIARLASVKRWGSLRAAEVLAEVRESLISAYPGCSRGLAFSTSHLKNIDHPVLIIGRSSHGSSLAGPDSAISQVIFLYIGRTTPSTEDKLMLRQLSRALSDRRVYSMTSQTSTPDQLWECLVIIDRDYFEM